MKQAAKVSCWVLLVGMFCAVAASGQTPGQLLQTGFVVITPKSPATGQNMVVSSTFGNRSSCGATQAGVQAARLGTSGMIPIAANTALQRDLGVAIVNLNDTVAQVTFTLRDYTGGVVATVGVQVNPMSNQAFYASQLFSGNSAAVTALAQDFIGTVTFESNLPVAVIGLRFQGSNFSTVPAIVTSETNFDIPTLGTGIGGPGAIVLPQFAVGGGWNTQIAVTNNSIVQPQEFRVDLFDQQGNPLSIDLNGETGSSFTNLSVPVGGALFLTTNATGGNPF